MPLLCGVLKAGEPATTVAAVTTDFVTANAGTLSGSGHASKPAVNVTDDGGGGATTKAIPMTTFCGFTVTPEQVIDGLLSA